jgi:ribosomal protein S18 acetylase RimI-like enzyme
VLSPNETNNIEIVEADLSNPAHAHDVRAMTAAYACDPMGNDGRLDEAVLDRTMAGLRAMPHARVWIAYDAGAPVGLATCFVGFSTFAGRPVINIHDLAVVQTHRGRGVGRGLLRAVEAQARSMGCSKVTLEVGDANPRAKGLYESCGFEHASAGPHAGRALFYAKYL